MVQHGIAKNHITMTIPMFLHLFILVSFSFWASSQLLLPPDSNYLVTSALPSQVLLHVCNFSSPRPRSRGSTDSSDALFLTLLDGSRGRLAGQCLQSLRQWTGTSQVLPFTHLSLTDSPRVTSVLQAPFVGSALEWCIPFYLLYHILLYIFYVWIYLYTQMPLWCS